MKVLDIVFLITPVLFKYLGLIVDNTIGKKKKIYSCSRSYSLQLRKPLQAAGQELTSLD